MDCIDHGVGFVAGIFHLPKSGAALYQCRDCQFGDAIGNGGRAILGLAWHWRAPLGDNDGRHRGGTSGTWLSHYAHTMVCRQPDKHQLDIISNKWRHNA